MRNENDLYKTFLRTVEQKISLEKIENCYETRNAFCSSKKLSDENEFNERFAEEVSQYFGLKYYQQSCIMGDDLDIMKQAKQIISGKMDTEDIKVPFSRNYKWAFVFNSNESK